MNTYNALATTPLREARDEWTRREHQAATERAQCTDALSARYLPLTTALAAAALTASLFGRGTPARLRFVVLAGLGAVAIASAARWQYRYDECIRMHAYDNKQAYDWFMRQRRSL